MGLLGDATKAVAKKALDVAYDKISNKNGDSNASDCQTYNVVDTEEFYEVMANSKYHFEKKEKLVLYNYYVDVHGILGCEADLVMLTNRHIVVEYNSGFLGNKGHINVFDLSNLNRIDGVIQIRQGNFEDEPALEMDFSNGSLFFIFEDEGSEKKQSRCIQNWIHNMTKILSLEKSSASDVKRCPNCGKVVPIEFHFCMECGAVIEDVSTAVGKQPETFLEDQPTRNNVAKKKETLSIERQIELLQKLKSLVEAGVLSQEEFEQKKKEIL